MRQTIIALFLLLIVFPAAAQDDLETPFVFGMVLVGAKDDGGWSQAHYEGGLHIEEQLEADMILQESFFAADEPMEAVVERMVDEGAEVIFMTSADFAADTNRIALEYPDVAFIQVAGDTVLTTAAPANVGNVMGQMEHAKFVVGCAAALTTRTGSIGYLGPLIDNETRRLAASAYLGANHCWQQYRGSERGSIQFQVEWVGYWFHIPEQTNNPRRQVFAMYNNGIDVVIAGIDTPTPLEVASEFAADGQNVFATGYDSIVSCEQFTEVCIGAAFYNWGIPYAEVAEAVMDDEWLPQWDWVAPNWTTFDDVERTPVGYIIGDAFPVARVGQLRDFLTDLETFSTNQFVPPSFPLWQGPLRFQNGTSLAEEGELVNVLDVWYLPQLLQGMEGESYQEELALAFSP